MVTANLIAAAIASCSEQNIVKFVVDEKSLMLAVSGVATFISAAEVGWVGLVRSGYARRCEVSN